MIMPYNIIRVQAAIILWPMILPSHPPTYNNNKIVTECLYHTQPYQHIARTSYPYR